MADNQKSDETNEKIHIPSQNIQMNNEYMHKRWRITMRLCMEFVKNDQLVEDKIIKEVRSR